MSPADLPSPGDRRALSAPSRPPTRSIVFHGHFYQPPREDPWTGRVPLQASAAPFHDWNERVAAECYAPIVAARVLADEDGPERRVNALEWISFDFGPTLLRWMERHAAEAYRAVLDADRRSCARLGGHGNALAMPYHHPILPLATPRDRLTEIRWGIADFRTRFGRQPEGMWLPETAVDDATLDALAAEGIRFTVLAPHQVDPVPTDGRPARYVTRGGREIALFVYDGALSHAVAFGDLLDDGVAWADAMANEPDPPALHSLATDGETFGHHHTFGEMALAKAIVRLRARRDIRLESFASFLAREGTGPTVRLVEPSSWSCAHGVERWRSDCGCRAGADESSQAWRAPLRSALEWLARELHRVYEREAAGIFEDPWAARDAYGWVVAGAEAPFGEPVAGGEPVERGESTGRGEPTGGSEATEHGEPVERAESSDRAESTERNEPTERGEPVERTERAEPTERGRRAVELLEMERNVLRLFTSCAWFFEDVARVEPRQVLRYAERALELAGADGDRLRPGFVDRLAAAESNDPKAGTAADLFRFVRSGRGGAG